MINISNDQATYSILNMCNLCRYAWFSQAQSHIYICTHMYIHMSYSVLHVAWSHYTKWCQPGVWRSLDNEEPGNDVSPIINTYSVSFLRINTHSEKLLAFIPCYLCQHRIKDGSCISLYPNNFGYKVIHMHICTYTYIYVCGSVYSHWQNLLVLTEFLRSYIELVLSCKKWLD